MEEQTGTIDIRKYLFILRRRWVLSASAFVLVLTMGIAYCLFWPRTYQATALIVVQPQKVPRGIVKATVTTKIEERLQIITQQVLSRTRLTEIMDRFDLYPKLRGKVAPDELAERMRKDISIQITRKNYFTITFNYTDPKATAAVTNALASFYVDSNLRLREEDAVGTARFLSREIERLRNELRAREDKITRFKEKHLHELPDAQEKNVNILGQLQDKDTMLRQMIQAERTRINVQEQELGVLAFREQQIARDRAMLRKQGASMTTNAGQGQETTPETIKKEIERLRILYTDRHPDIIRLKRQLVKVEARQRMEMEKRRAEAKAKGLKFDEKVTKQDLELASIRQSKDRVAKRIQEGEARVRELEAERKKLKQMIELTQQRIENAPAVAEKLNELTRDYEILKSAYEKTHAKWLEANMAANLERTQRGEQFEVVDPAQVPDSPYRPNVKRALPMSLAAALLLAVGLAFGLDFIDTSFTSVEQAESMTELPVLVVIPPLLTHRELARKRRNLALLGVIFGGAFLFLLGMVGLLITGRAEAIRALLARYL